LKRQVSWLIVIATHTFPFQRNSGNCEQLRITVAGQR
jgi:hypothetical protein